MPNGAATDEELMRRCLALAQSAAELGETAVGALVVRAGRILGEGMEGTRRLLDPSAHAETVAIRAACQREASLSLHGCVLVTTVEPCVLCAYAIRRTHIGRVVYGVDAGELGGITSRYAVLADQTLSNGPPPTLVGGVLKSECLDMLSKGKDDRKH